MVVQREASQFFPEAPSRPVPDISISLNPTLVASWLSAIFMTLLIAHLVTMYLSQTLGLGESIGLGHVFNFSDEQNFPTLFATGLFFFNAACLCLLARVTPARASRWTWYFLAVVFCALGVDEYASVHERLSEPVRALLDQDRYGLLFFAWIIPYGIGVAILGLLTLPAWWRLGQRLRMLFVLSAVLFLAGAIGIEMLEGAYREANGAGRTLTYRMLNTLEESLEFAGLILFAYVVLSAVRGACPELTVSATFRRRRSPSILRDL